ncbi:membrane protein insertion efficiency factor YidD [Pseudoalteromonas sp. NBT06-2]|uniref:membrane protein insertion efficiency factor YidD n=1 Tax=Pseudoalteromonas sp. NBT06-2 TaxID=2025950 RepID=UPI000BA6F5EC|nr:membrane protein insertion efficiency factor YidD [Pseudoalteromonas sp. NBT06-2]PAJ75907.1 membrane protein insertion efficiency factor YidD [Pseudoalteromonas sp. NBT06-2]
MNIILLLPKKILMLLIKSYQKFISPFLGSNCRFNPTCSSYAINAIELHGSVKGSWLTLKRIIKCHPLHSGGEDPVPGNPINLKDEK